MLRELNRAIGYIEEHLGDELPLEAIAGHVGVSDHHFRTVFFHLAGMPLSEYVKNRRLAEANKALLRGESVTQVAYQYGYQSLDGFSRAFKSWCGLLPSQAAKERRCKSFPKLSFIIKVTGGNTMEFRIEEKPAFFLAGVSRRVPMQFEGVNNAILELANSITEEQRAAMHALQDMEPREVVNASYNADAGFLKEEGELTHLIGVLTTKGEGGPLLERVPVKAGSWAVFPNAGPFPATLQSTMARIYAEWLPASDYELVDQPGFSFTKMDPDREGHAYSEVWTPVRKK